MWNVVPLRVDPSSEAMEYFIVDIMHNPAKLYAQGSDKAKKYTRYEGRRADCDGFVLRGDWCYDMRRAERRYEGKDLVPGFGGDSVPIGDAQVRGRAMLARSGRAFIDLSAS